MLYSPASLRLLGYNVRGEHWKDYVTWTMQPWYKFAPDHSIAQFAWYSQEAHRNSQGTTHGGALMTYIDYCMAATVWDLTGKAAYTIELNNMFIRPARTKRWLFTEVWPKMKDNEIELEAIMRANDPTGMIVMKSFGRFTLPKELKVLDDDE
jgi:hypothetical protein